jgi:hypothetical protein
MRTLSAIDLEDYFDRVVSDRYDFPSFKIGARIAVVERVIELAERAIPSFQAKAISEAHIDLAKYKYIYSGSDITDWKESLRTETTEIIPTAFHSSSVIMMTAAHEQCLTDLSNYIERRCTATEVFALLGGKAAIMLPPVDRLKLMAQMKSIGDVPTRQGIKALQHVRNSIAHASGILTGDTPQRVSALRQLATSRSGISIEGERVVVSIEFLRGSMSCIVEQLNVAMQAVVARYPS